LALAEAERVADDIRSGMRTLCDAKYALFLTEISASGKQPIDSSRPLQIATDSVVADSLRKEINVAKAITHAENELRDDPTPPTEKKIQEDWLYRWRNYAGEVSSDELQALWGRILAGEIKSPGSYSYRLLDFVKNLTKDEAQLIEKVSSLVFVDFIAREPESALTDENLKFSTFLELQELGIVAGVEALGLTKTFSSISEEKFLRLLLCLGKGLLIQHADSKKKLEMKAYIITSLGKQVMKLGKFSPNLKYIRAIGSELKKAEFSVSIVDYVDAGNEMVSCFNAEELK